MNFGEIIRTFRLKNNLTQEELAGMLSVSSQAVSKWERNESMPDTTMLPAIADALGISLDRLFDRKSFSFEDIAHGISHFMIHKSSKEQFQDTKKIAHLCEYMLQNAYGADGFNYENYTESCCQDSNDGFTFASNRPELPFFSVFIKPKDGWEKVLFPDSYTPLDNIHVFHNVADVPKKTATTIYQDFFRILSDEIVLETIRALLKKKDGFSFDETYAATEFGSAVSADVLDKIVQTKLLRTETVEINGVETRIWFNRPRCGIVAILAMAEEYLNHQKCFDLYCGPRSKPYF